MKTIGKDGAKLAVFRTLRSTSALQGYHLHARQLMAFYFILIIFLNRDAQIS